jgi:hypothetical protein
VLERFGGFQNSGVECVHGLSAYSRRPLQ